MNLFGIGKIIDGVGKIADDLHTSKEEKLEIALKERAMDVSLMQGQIEVNKAEAQHKSVFVAGWRPFIGWVGGLALAYQFLLFPILVWAWSLLQAKGAIPCHIDPAAIAEMTSAAVNAAAETQLDDSPIRPISLTECSFKHPPAFEADVLFTIVTGMLGIGGMRSYDKLKKTDTAKVGK